MGLQQLMTVVCFLIILQAVVLFIFPDIIFGAVDWDYSLPVLVGVIATVVVGEMLLKRANSQLETKEVRGVA